MPTTVHGLPYPLSTAPPNVPVDIQALAEAIEVMPAAEIPAAANLNTYTNPGIWAQSQSAEASTANNYPIAQAGLLEVFRNSSGGVQVWQRYTVYGAAFAFGANTYVRALYSGTWTTWREVYADTGWLNVAGSTVTGTTRYRRVSGIAYVQVDGNATTVSGTPFTIAAAGAIPVGFRPGVVQVRAAGYFSAFGGILTVGLDGSFTAIQQSGANRATVAGIVTYPCDA